MTLSFRALHEKLIQEECIHKMIASDISQKQEELDKRIRTWISDLRYFCVLDIWYPSLSMSNVSEFLKLSKFMRETHKVYDSLSAVPVASSKQIEQFLSNSQRYVRVLCKCADYYFETVSDDMRCRCVPGEKVVSFFAASTFPALFGYSWCKEQGLMYIEGICMMLVLQTSKSHVMSVEFRTKSYLRDIIRHFFHMEGIQKYLRKALGTKMTDMMHDSKFLRHDRATTVSKKYMDTLFQYALKFKQGLIESLGHFPPLLKFFFRRAFEIGEMALVKLLFFDFVLSPALANPQLFGITSETTYVVQTKRIVSDLNHLFRWAMSPESAAEGDERVIEFKELIESPEFQDLSLQKVLDKLVEPKDQVSGTSLLQLNSVTNAGYHWLLLSLNDLQFISEIVRHSIDHIQGEEPRVKQELERLTDFGLNLQSDEIIDFWFKSTTLPPETLRGMRGTIHPEVFELNLQILETKFEDADSDPAFDPLVRYLQTMKPNRAAPDTLSSFLQFQRDQATQSKNPALAAKTQYLQQKLKDITDDEAHKALDQAIEKGLCQAKHDLAVVFRHQECIEHVTAEAGSVSTINDQLAPIIHQAILSLFLNRHKEIPKDVGTRKSELLTSPSVWRDLFVSLNNDLRSFVSEMGMSDPIHHKRLTRQFHTKLCAELPIREYRKLHHDLLSTDKALVAGYDAALEKFMKDKFSKVLAQIFQAPECFASAIEGFQGRTRYGSPLEFLQRIGECMVAVQDIYLFEAGEACPADDLLPLFVYTLLRAKLQNLFSLSRYLDAMLIQANDGVKMLDPKERYVATTFMTSVDAICGLANVPFK